MAGRVGTAGDSAIGLVADVAQIREHGEAAPDDVLAQHIDRVSRGGVVVSLGYDPNASDSAEVLIGLLTKPATPSSSATRGRPRRASIAIGS